MITPQMADKTGDMNRCPACNGEIVYVYDGFWHVYHRVNVHDRDLFGPGARIGTPSRTTAWRLRRELMQRCFPDAPLYYRYY